VIDAPLAYAFALGMVALVNPCGFALLPAYLSFFLGLDTDAGQRRIHALNRAQLVGLALSCGFLTVFGVLGLVFAGIYSSIRDWLPWVTFAIGLGLVGLGAAMVRGLRLDVPLPKLERGTGSRQVASMYLFGVSYAVASLSCTIGLFLGAAGVSAAGANFASRLASFLAYGAGMGLLATALTLAVALGKRRLVTRFRALLPRIHLVSALVLLVVGAYVAYFGWWSIDPIGRPMGPVRPVEDTQRVLSNVLSDRAAVLGWLFLTVNATLVAWGWVDRQRRPAAADPPARSGAVRHRGT
jgi:cytochrome c-type biogenesis protein